MELATETLDSALVVTPSDVVDHDSAPSFESQLQTIITDAGTQRTLVVIDMAKVDYMSTVGLRVLMRASKRARELSVDIRVANMSKCMREIFQISRFDKVISVFENVDAAIAG